MHPRDQVLAADHSEADRAAGEAHLVADVAWVEHLVAGLDAGAILEEGPAEQILTDPREPRTQQFLQRVIEAGRLAV